MYVLTCEVLLYCPIIEGHVSQLNLQLLQRCILALLQQVTLQALLLRMKPQSSEDKS
jgi:hypothetical protein